jgi:hypothetical protein
MKSKKPMIMIAIGMSDKKPKEKMMGGGMTYAEDNGRMMGGGMTYAEGGSTGRGGRDGCAIKGKTKGRVL